MTTRWILTDGLTSYTFEVNPYEMTSMSPTYSKDSVPSPVLGRPMGLASRSMPTDWSFTGKAYSQQQYDDLLSWYEIERPLVLTDHFGNSWNVLLYSFAPKDLRRPGTITKWQYEMKAYILGEVP